jgi:hypothetical protein
MLRRDGVARRTRFLVAAVTLLGFAGPMSVHAAAKARTFTVSYDGTGHFNYTVRGSTTDTGCYRSLGNNSPYGWDQLWRVKASFSKDRKGHFDFKIDSLIHVDGPQAIGGNDGSHVKGSQGTHNGDCFDPTVGGPDTGIFDCTSGPPTLTAWSNPQMDISSKGGDMVVLARAFLTANMEYHGQDTVPTDKGCGFFDADWTYGSTLIPGSYATAKVSLPVKQLASLGRGQKVTKDVGLGKNTEFKPVADCNTTFGAPRFCILHEQKLNGTFRWQRSK